MTKNEATNVLDLLALYMLLKKDLPTPKRPEPKKKRVVKKGK
ncbi:MAG: hypothetical protein Q7T03_00185 [Deltaproteobacteria bacterium]|nr:hypothetical protein [Deltaproteobacteria bacterium]